MWVVTLHNLFLHSEPPLTCHHPSYWFRLFSSQTFSRINTPTFLKSRHTSYLPAYEDGTDKVFETSTYKIKTPGNYQEEIIQHSEQGESLKSRKYSFFTQCILWPTCTAIEIKTFRHLIFSAFVNSPSLCQNMKSCRPAICHFLSASKHCAPMTE